MGNNTDCCFRSGNDRFRYRVGAIIISGEYALFAYSERDKYYCSVAAEFTWENINVRNMISVRKLPLSLLWSRRRSFRLLLMSRGTYRELPNDDIC